MSQVSTWALAIALLTAAPAAAQTAIVPDQGAAGTGTMVSTAGSVTTIGNGTLAGENLFHSFTRFDLAVGDIARWVRGQPDAAAIANVVNRVTGGDPSLIYGTLRVADMPNADFWFINPAGIILGNGAAVDVPGAAYFSTAQALHFSDGGSFTTVTPGGSTFSSAAPEAFGFLGMQQDIIVAGVEDDFANAAMRLSFFARNIGVQGEFETGVFDLVAVGDAHLDLPVSDPMVLAGPGNVSIGPGSDLVSGRYRIAAERIDLFNATLETPEASGTSGIVMLGGDLTIEGGGLFATSQSGASAKGIVLAAKSIDLLDTIVASDIGDITITAQTLVSDGSTIQTYTLGADDAGRIAVGANEMSLFGGSYLVSDVREGATGSAQGITITADSLTVNNSLLGSATFGLGDSGLLSISSAEIVFSDGSFVFSDVEAGAAGNSGGLLLGAGTLRIDSSSLSSSTFGMGTAGLTKVFANEILLIGGADIRSLAYPGSTGAARGIFVEAGSLTLDASALASFAYGVGDAGSLTLIADNIVLSRGAFVASDTIGPATGNAGNVLVDAGSLILDDASLSSSTFGQGAAGLVDITADEIVLINGAFLGSRAERGSSGGAGNLLIDTGFLGLDGANLSSSTFGQGDGGNVNISADTLILLNDTLLGSQTNPDATGNAGQVDIRAGSVTVAGSRISSSTYGPGAAGAVSIAANSITMTFGGEINSRSEFGATGNAGTVSISAREIDLAQVSSIGSTTEGRGDGGNLEIFAEVIRLADRSLLSTSTYADGNAGSLHIRNRSPEQNGKLDIVLDGFSTISSLTQEGQGDTGAIAIDANSIHLMHGSRIYTDARPLSSGIAGSILISADDILLEQASVIRSTTAGSGDAGSVVLLADRLLQNQSLISSSTYGGGRAGSVTIKGRDGANPANNSISLGNGSEISSITAGAGDAGLVDIVARDVTLFGQSTITSQTEFGTTGSAGDVRLNSGTLTVYGRSLVSSATAGSGNAGRVDLTIGALNIEDGSITTSTVNSGRAGTLSVSSDTIVLGPKAFIVSAAGPNSTGDGGDVVISARLLLMDDATVSASTLGSGDAGMIYVKSPEVHLIDNSNVSSAALEGSTGQGGQVTFEVDTLEMSGSEISVSTIGPGDAGSLTVRAGAIGMVGNSFLASQALDGSTGKAGAVDVEADVLRMVGSEISSSTFGAGNAGSVSIRVADIGLTGRSALTSQTGEDATGNAGDVVVAADQLRANASIIDSSTFGAGNAGRVDVLAQRIILSDDAAIASQGRPGSSGKAGGTVVEVDTLRLDGKSQISSSAFGDGDGGSVFVTARDIGLSGGGGLASLAGAESKGNAGDVHVQGDVLLLDSAAQITSSTLSRGNGGLVEVTVRDITLTGDSSIVSQASAGSSGNGGDAVITADLLRVEGSQISTSAFGSGKAGSVTIHGRDVTLAQEALVASQSEPGATGAGGNVSISADVLRINRAEVSASTYAAGNAGSVNVSARDISLADEGYLVSISNVGATGNAGQVNVAAETLRVTYSQISSSTTGIGNAGTVKVVAELLEIDDSGSLASSTVGTGKAGSVDVFANEIILASGFISSVTGGGGNAGSVTVKTNRITLGETGFITTLSVGSGDAGDISIEADSLVIDGSGAINSSSGAQGDAGSIFIRARTIDLFEGGNIATNSEFGPAGDITLLMPKSGRLTLAGATPGIITTTSGPSTGGRITISDPYLILSAGGAILALGDQTGANVRIASDFFIRSADRPNLLSVNGSLVLDSQIDDLSAGTEAPDIDFLDASSVLSGQCATARSTGRTSRFTSRITGPYVSVAPVMPTTPSAANSTPVTVRFNLVPCG